MKRILIYALLCALLVLTACGGGNANPPEGEGTPSTVTVSELFSDRDYDWAYTEARCIPIDLTARASGEGYTWEGSTVTITQEGSYLVTGSLQGTLMVDTDKNEKVQIILNNAKIESETSAAIYVKNCDKVFLTLAEGSENTLINSGTYTQVDENNIDAALFSKDDLTLNGTGSLAVTSPGGHGIVSKDSLTLTGGGYTISCAGHGLSANDDIALDGVKMTITAGKDGIHSEHDTDAILGIVYVKSGELSITAEGDGISASANVQMDEGRFAITAGGGYENGSKENSGSYGGFMGGPGGNRPGGKGKPSGITTMEPAEEDADASTSMKGIKAGTELKLLGGSYEINSADDGLHSNDTLVIGGGTFAIQSGDDGIHGENDVIILGGTITVSESYEGLEGYHITIEGGTITLNSTDDGINAAGGTDQSGFGGRDDMGPGGHGPMAKGDGSITLSGGTVDITARGDGIDANGSVTISGGYTTVCGPTMGDTATLDYDTTASINGGTFIGTGANGMAQSFSDGTQGVFAVSLNDAPAGTELCLYNADGKLVLSHTPKLSFGVIILSSPEIVKGESYTIEVDGVSGTFTAQ